MKSPKSRCLTNRNVRHIIEAMLHNWCAKCIALLGSEPGPGAIEFEEVILKDGTRRNFHIDDNEEDFLDTTPDSAPSWSRDSSITVPEIEAEILRTESGELGRSQLITLADGVSAANSVANKALNEYEVRLRRTDVGPISYRPWLMIKGSRKLMVNELAVAQESMARACLNARKKLIGVQCISTRAKRKPLPRYGGTSFNGKYAFRQFQGRPLLPENEWLRRYRKRRAKLKKSGSKPPIKAPPTVTQRPDTAAIIAAKKAAKEAGLGARGRPPISTKDWIVRYKARKAKWNATRGSSAALPRITHAPTSAHQRPPRILNLKCDHKRSEIYQNGSEQLEDFFTPSELELESDSR